ncbi:MAG: ATP-binding cassette domain-containing protein, partial [Planctomycetota bacterium]|nr:ATP-binding cassette domain-containing protein [Planctomycetota bacterium]
SFDLRDLKIEDYLQQVGVVFQRPIMFEDTILNNVKYGCQDATPEEVIRACNIAQAHDFIQQLPQQYETTLGAHDSGLSGGQIQRISLARIILRDPKILILDEATSALDTETEMQIKAGLDYLMRGRTTVAIAHRLSTIVDADKIVVLDRGRIQEIGNHEELLAKRGLYYGLCQKQLGESGEMH